MRKKITIFTIALLSAVTISGGSGTAFAATDKTSSAISASNKSDIKVGDEIEITEDEIPASCEFAEDPEDDAEADLENASGAAVDEGDDTEVSDDSDDGDDAEVSDDSDVEEVEDGDDAEVSDSSDKKTSSTKKTTSKKTTAKKYDAGEVKLLACLIYTEAGNQSYKGKLAVGNVVVNRIKSSKFPNTMKGVIYQPYQFGVCGNSRLTAALNSYSNNWGVSASIKAQCVKAAKAALDGKSATSENYYFFCRYSSSLAKRRPNGVKIGAHYFYK